MNEGEEGLGTKRDEPTREGHWELQVMQRPTTRLGEQLATTRPLLKMSSGAALVLTLQRLSNLHSLSSNH